MIDSYFIESAKIIRKEFLKLSSNLSTYEKEVKGLADFLTKKIEEITEYKDNRMSNIRTKDDVSEISTHLMNEIQSIEDEESRLKKLIESVNTKIESLRKDETNLYEAIKKKYPELSDQQIVNSIHPHLEK
jgi:cell shape-determining protein MreC